MPVKRTKKPALTNLSTNTARLNAAIIKRKQAYRKQISPLRETDKGKTTKRRTGSVYVADPMVEHTGGAARVIEFAASNGLLASKLKNGRDPLTGKFWNTKNKNDVPISNASIIKQRVGKLPAGVQATKNQINRIKDSDKFRQQAKFDVVNINSVVVTKQSLHSSSLIAKSDEIAKTNKRFSVNVIRGKDGKNYLVSDQETFAAHVLSRNKDGKRSVNAYVIEEGATIQRNKRRK